MKQKQSNKETKTTMTTTIAAVAAARNMLVLLSQLVMVSSSIGIIFATSSIVQVDAFQNHHHLHQSSKLFQISRDQQSAVSSSLSLSSATNNELLIDEVTLTQERKFNDDQSKKKRRRRRCRCPDDHDDSMDLEDMLLGFNDGESSGSVDRFRSAATSTTMDKEDDESRRELFFSTMGAVWASVTTMAVAAQPAMATAGVDAKMEFPDVMQGMADRNNKQCLVESLGNRECLVYQEDSDKFLYKGADASVLIDRLQTTFRALNDIPPLVETKQWTKITGLLTGPMGQLSATLTMIVKLKSESSSSSDKNSSSSKVLKAAQKVKNDVFGMGTATQQRQAAEILKYQQLAVADLESFIKEL